MGLHGMPLSDSRKLIIFNFLHYVIPTRDLFEIVSWNHDDDINHDPLHMRITNLR